MRHRHPDDCMKRISVDFEVTKCIGIIEGDQELSITNLYLPPARSRHWSTEYLEDLRPRARQGGAIAGDLTSGRATAWSSRPGR